MEQSVAPLRALSWNVGMGSPLPQGERHERAWRWVSGHRPLPDVLLLQQVIPGRFANGWPVAWGPVFDSRGCRVAVAARPGWTVEPIEIARPSWARWQGRSVVVGARVGPPGGPPWTVVSAHVGYDDSATRWLRHLVTELSWVDGPVMIGGDFSQPVNRTPRQSRMFEAAAFAGFHFVCGSGEELLPTTEQSQTDHLWVRGVDTAHLDWRIDATVQAGPDPLAGHAALWFTGWPVAAVAESAKSG
jgi:hypothetical protein